MCDSPWSSFDKIALKIRSIDDAEIPRESVYRSFINRLYYYYYHKMIDFLVKNGAKKSDITDYSTHQRVIQEFQKLVTEDTALAKIAASYERLKTKRVHSDYKEDPLYVDKNKEQKSIEKILKILSDFFKKDQ